MIKILILILLPNLTNNAEIVLIVSNLATATLKSPSDQELVVQNYHTTNQPNFLGSGAQWLWVTGSSWPANYSITVQTVFMATSAKCESIPGVIYITADDSFILYLNGVQIGSGSSWVTAFNFTVTYINGTNNLTAIAKNVINNSPAGIIYKVAQNQNCNTSTNSTNKNNTDQNNTDQNNTNQNNTNQNNTNNQNNTSPNSTNQNSTNNPTEVTGSSSNSVLAIAIAVPILILFFLIVAYCLLKSAPQPQATQLAPTEQPRREDIADESVENVETNQQIVR